MLEIAKQTLKVNKLELWDKHHKHHICTTQFTQFKFKIQNLPFNLSVQIHSLSFLFYPLHIHRFHCNRNRNRNRNKVEFSKKRTTVADVRILNPFLFLNSWSMFMFKLYNCSLTFSLPLFVAVIVRKQHSDIQVRTLSSFQYNWIYKVPHILHNFPMIYLFLIDILDYWVLIFDVWLSTFEFWFFS